MNKNSILAKGKACILQAWKEPIMKTKVFINGHEGTTGLRIHDRLKSRDDIELISIDDELRKDPKAVKDCLAAADIAFLCLPDGAAREAAVLAEDLSVRLIDTSDGASDGGGMDLRVSRIVGNAACGYCRRQAHRQSRMSRQRCYCRCAAVDSSRCYGR